MALRLLGFFLVTAGAWSGLTDAGDGQPPAAGVLLSAAMLAVGFAPAFRDDPYIPRRVYFGAASLTVAILLVVALGSGFDGQVADWVRLITNGAGGFLAIAVTLSALSTLLYVSAAGEELSQADRGRADHVAVFKELFLTVLAGAYAIPIGVGTAVLVGVGLPAWPGVAVGLSAGVVVAALGSNVSVAAAWGLSRGMLPMLLAAKSASQGHGGVSALVKTPSGIVSAGSTELYEAAARAPVSLVAAVFGVIASVIVGASGVSEFVLGQMVELIFAVVVAGMLTWGLLDLEMRLIDRGIGRAPVMALLSMAGAALGIGVGVGASRALLGDVTPGAGSWVPAALAVCVGAAVVAVSIQRLGSVIGFAATGGLVLLSGATLPVTLGLALAGSFVGVILAEIANLLIAIVVDGDSTRSQVLALGIVGGVAVGVLSGLPLASAA